MTSRARFGRQRAALLVVTLAAGGCGGGGGGGGSSAPPPTFAVGGTVSGLTAAGLVLANGTDTVSLAAGAMSFTFPRMLAGGASYAVSVQTQPAGLSCSVTAGSGTVGSASVTSVQVACVAGSYTVGGSITGLTAAGLVLANGSDAVAPDANQPNFQFAASVAPGTAYDVTIRMQPPGLACQVSNGSGTVGTSSVTSVTVSCGPRPWVWSGGSKVSKASGVYGMAGTPDPANVPGARSGASSWTDGAGNFWLFGGYAYDSTGAPGDVNDLWKYSPATAQWTWVGGSSAIGSTGVYGTLGMPSGANVPSARDGAALWTDRSGIVWLFGGEGYDSLGNYGSLQDLWRYDPSNGEWTWIGGPATAKGAGVYGTQGTPASGNLPGARDNAATWLDGAGDLWLFGGYGFDGTGGTTPIELNDLWMFDPTTKLWTWVGGSSTGNGPGSYGTQGVAAAGNVPGARYSASIWVDVAGLVWMFGGIGFDSAVTGAMALNDLWTLDPASGQWTWVGGPSIGNGSGVYGTRGTAAAGNQPGARFGAVSWRDSIGNFWLLGGDGYDATGGTIGRLNDLWEYTPATGNWTWVNGSNARDAAGVYGTVGVAASTNSPGGRYSASGWIDTLGHLWLFGGLGFDSVGAAEDELNDLWQY